MAGMQIPYLHTNQLTGTLPTEWSAMAEMQTLDLDTNHLTATPHRVVGDDRRCGSWISAQIS